jgi:hypothetical protein
VSSRSTKDLDERIRNGEPLVLGRPGDVRDLSVLPSETWQERTVAASVVEELCASADPSKRLKIDGVRIEGDLDLTAARCQREITLSSCLFTGRVILVNAHLVSLDMSGSILLKDMSAKNLRCGPLILRDVIAKDCVDLRWAEIDGPFECQDAEFEADAPESLVIREATISRSALLTRACVSGSVLATGVTVRGALACAEMNIGGAPWTEGETDRFGGRRGRILGGSRVAFMLNYARIDGPVDMGGSALGKPFSADGLVSMYSARMAALRCEKATFTNADGICLSLEHAEIANSALLRQGFKATGTVRLYAAEIGDALEMNGAS